MKSALWGGARRGFATLTGLMSLLVLLVALTSIVTMRSADMYRHGATLEHRLAVLAAAEGAARVVRADGAAAVPERIGSVRVAATEDGSGSVLLECTYVGKAGRDVLPLRYRLTARTDDEGTATWNALEPAS